MAEPIADKLAALMERTRSLVADKPGLVAMLEGLRQRAGVNGNGQTPPDEQPLVDKAELLQEKWKVRPGQIWQIGPHFVICGDCREADTWVRLLGAAGVEKVNGVFTSPPYAEQRKAQYGGVPTGEYVKWWEAVQSNVRANLAGDGSFFVNIKPHCEDGQRVLYVFDLVLAMVKEWCWRFVEELCWNSQASPGEWPDRLKNAFEPVYQFSISQIKFRPQNVIVPFKSDPDDLQVYGGENSQWKSAAGSSYGGHNVKSNKYNGALPSNVIKVASASDVGHSGAFPVALPTFFIKAYSDSGDTWLDPFCGSGTTIAACHNEGRIGMGIEKLPKYVSVILERLATLTQQHPRLVSE